MKKVYNFDPLNGEYIGESLADPNPREPGKFLIPDFATEEKPDKPNKGKKKVYKGGKWSDEDLPAPKPETPVVDAMTPEIMAMVERHNRNKLLKETDYRMLPDLYDAKTFEQWKAYRQELRDVPQNAGFPDKIKWPKPPVK